MEQNSEFPLRCGFAQLLLLLRPFNGLFSRTSWVSRHQKGKPLWIFWSKRWWGGIGISWTICKSFAPHSRQITTAVRHHSVFTGRMPSCHPTSSVKALKEIAHLVLRESREIKTEVHCSRPSCSLLGSVLLLF